MVLQARVIPKDHGYILRLQSNNTETVHRDTYINKIAGAWSLHLHARAAFVPRLPVSHPLYHRRSIISDRPLRDDQS